VPLRFEWPGGVLRSHADHDLLSPETPWASMTSMKRASAAVSPTLAEVMAATPRGRPLRRTPSAPRSDLVSLAMSPGRSMLRSQRSYAPRRQPPKPEVDENALESNCHVLRLRICLSVPLGKEGNRDHCSNVDDGQDSDDLCQCQHPVALTFGHTPSQLVPVGGWVRRVAADLIRASCCAIDLS